MMHVALPRAFSRLLKNAQKLEKCTLGAESVFSNILEKFKLILIFNILKYFKWHPHSLLGPYWGFWAIPKNLKNTLSAPRGCFTTFWTFILLQIVLIFLMKNSWKHPLYMALSGCFKNSSYSKNKKHCIE